ncbi:TrmJ/YjtD family RNA methyltransferase [archaeon]|nr:TrmJ/YjtD family RNA methyltransferase [archaeon]
MHRVVFVEPETPGNIGALARTMANFGLKELVLVNPCEIDEKAKARAVGALPILENAQIMAFNKAIHGFDAVIGTTARVYSDYNTTRAFVTPRELSKQFKKTKGNYCFVLGRESSGLKNNELRKCDISVHIPCSPGYRALNITHAAAILFYELFSEKENKSRTSTQRQKQDMLTLFEKLALSVDMRNPKNAVKQFNSVISRAFVSGSEAQGISGVLSRAYDRMEKRNV